MKLPEIEPCPFCGKKPELIDMRPSEHRFFLDCDFCGYRSWINTSPESIINAHNRIFKKARHE